MVPAGGGGTPDAGGGGTGIVATEAGYTQNVLPIVTTKGCMPGGTACHGGGNQPNLTSFANLMDKYKTKPGMSNVLVTKLAGGAHQGKPDYMDNEKTAIANWIDGK